jgi:hypothetical protein
MKTAEEITREQLAFAPDVFKGYSNPFNARVPNEINKNIRQDYNARMISFAKDINKDIPDVVQSPQRSTQGSGPIEGTSMSVTVG